MPPPMIATRVIEQPSFYLLVVLASIVTDHLAPCLIAFLFLTSAAQTRGPKLEAEVGDRTWIPDRKPPENPICRSGTRCRWSSPSPRPPTGPPRCRPAPASLPE